MNILGFQFGKQAIKTPEVINIPRDNSDAVDGFSLNAVTDLPVITESRNYDWVNYGDDNLYPEYLKSMYNTSPTHNAIVKTKAQMVVGEGYTIDETFLDEKQKIDALKIIQDIEKDKYDLSLDFQLYGAMAFEVIWSLDFSRVVEVNRLDVSKLRSGKYDDGEVEEWFYKRNWNDRREDEVCIDVLDTSNKEDHRQIYYVSGPKVSNEYYGEPTYLSAMDWITLESQVGLYYRSLIENGFNPSVIVKFYRKPASQEERDDVVSGLKRTFGGVKRAGKAMVMFSDGKELAPDVVPVEVSNVDKQFTIISDQITQKILTGERATTPELFSIMVPGQLGNGDFETKVKCFTKFVIQPDQRVFENAVNDILKLNGFNIHYKLKPFTI
jgi:hypothetical protein